MYRLHIDIPVGTDQQEAIELSRQFMFWMRQSFAQSSLNESSTNMDFSSKVSQLPIGVRLGHDDDRNKSNYLDIDENGHASTKKIRFRFVDDS